MNAKNINELINEALAIEHYEAKESGALGYMCRSLVQATMPHSATTEKTFVRKNGDFILTMTALNELYGLPYGSIPRLLIAWLSTEAVKTKNRELILGDNLSDFMAQLGLNRTGGKRGDIGRLQKQSHALFNCAVSCSYTNKSLDGLVAAGKHILVAEDHFLWWQVKEDARQTSLFQSRVILSTSFYNEITSHPVPIDLRALKSLKRSSMALDIYTWLTYRMFTLRKSTKIPWEALQLQFGSHYKVTRQFKAAFVEQLKKVLIIYPEAKVVELSDGLLLKPSPTHIPQIDKQ